MKIYCKKINGHLVPESELKIKEGEWVQVEIKKPRNIYFHRKYFAMLNIVLDNQTKYANVNDLLTEIKLRLGHYQEYIDHQGRLIYVPRSISFAAMDDLEFQKFYSKTIRAILANVVKIDPEELERQVNQIIGF